MSERTILLDGVRIPRFLYGTAWKEDETARLTALALQQGFRGIDTANQRRHYHEAGVGEAVAAAIESGLVMRDDLFLQTKFTFRDGQDHRLPYDAKAPISVQVEQSFANSLEHFSLIHPCGFHDVRMTSIAEQLGARAPSLARVRSAVTSELVARLGFDGFVDARADAVWALAGIASPADTSNQDGVGRGPHRTGRSEGVQAW